MVDFERIIDGTTRLSLGAVNVRTGNFCYFDTAHRRIDARHVMASGALPPGFPPEDIGRVVAFLAGADAGFITGATIDVNGGQYLG
jgi:NTE family protein